MKKSQVNLPNFFILGAGRSGTTSLTRALNLHPDVFIPSIKEPSFFASSFQWVKDPARYVSLYEGASTATAVGDASHIYLEDPESPRILQAFFPDARFVLVFRHPADRALGLYADMVKGGYEIHRTFEAALAAEDRRYYSRRFRQNCPQSFWNYMYVRSGLFGEQMARYLNHFEREQFWFTTLRDLIHEPTDVIRSLCDHLGLDAIELNEFPRDGTSKGTRSITIQYLDRRMMRPLARRIGAPAQTLSTRLNRWNRLAMKPEMLPGTRERLERLFEADLTLLNQLTGIDLRRR